MKHPLCRASCRVQIHRRSVGLLRLFLFLTSWFTSSVNHRDGVGWARKDTKAAACACVSNDLGLAVALNRHQRTLHINEVEFDGVIITNDGALIATNALSLLNKSNRTFSSLGVGTLLAALPVERCPDANGFLLASLSETHLSEGVVHELRVLGVIVGGLLAALLVVVLLRAALRRSHLALRVASTFLTVGSVVAVPIVLSVVSIYKILLAMAACGYFLAAAVRVPMMFGKPRACAIIMQGYDYFLGGLLLALLSLLSLPQFCRALQTKSLLSAVFERRVAHQEIMRLLEASSK